MRGLLNLLTVLHPGTQPHGVRFFPAELKPSPRYEPGPGGVLPWLAEVVDSRLSGNLEKCSISPHISTFCEARWSDLVQIGATVPVASLSHVCVQVVASIGCDLETQLIQHHEGCKPDGTTHYLRLDLDQETLFSGLREDFPHVHSVGNDEPRLPLVIGESGNIIVDFFDVIYRNYEYAEWQDWVRFTWSRRRANLAGTARDPLTRLFTRGSLQTVNDVLALAPGVAELRDAIVEARDEMTPFRFPRDLRTALNLV